MKKLYFLGIVLMAVLMSVNLASCSNEDVIQEETTEDKYITVGLDCVGEYLEVADSPLSRAMGDDIYFIQVYSLGEEYYSGPADKYITEETPYAYGIFETSLDGVTIKLLEGKDYRFMVGIGVKSAGYVEGSGYSKEFNYSSTSSIYPADRISVHYEGFYGELDRYTPVKDSNVSISTKRVSYAAKFIAEGLNEGELNIQVSRPKYWSLYSVSLTPTNPEHDKIYSFDDAYWAWKGIETPTGNHDPNTDQPLYEYKNYTSEKQLDISWTKANGEVFPLGVYYVTFKRNIRTTIRIKVEDRSVSNGITVTREDTPIIDDENEYVIEGGQVVEVPMSSSQS